MGCDYFVAKYLDVVWRSGETHTYELFKRKCWYLDFYPSDSDASDVEERADAYYASQIARQNKPDKVLCEDGTWISDHVKAKYTFPDKENVVSVIKRTSAWERH